MRVGGRQKLIFEFKIFGNKKIGHADVVGAIFNEAGDIFAPTIDFTELSDCGELGRFSVDIRRENNLSAGVLEIDVDPASYPAESRPAVTAIIAAAIESVESVRGCRARFELRGWVDRTAERRERAVARALEILERMS